MNVQKQRSDEKIAGETNDVGVRRKTRETLSKENRDKQMN
jgi:hypothetical protein